MSPAVVHLKITWADAEPAPEADAVNVIVTSVPISAEFVVKNEVATPLLFVFGDESDQLAVTPLLLDIGVARVTSIPEIAVPFTSVTVKEILVDSEAPASESVTSPVPETEILPREKVAVVLAEKEPAVARIVATPPVELDNVTSASPSASTEADETLRVPNELVKLTVPGTWPVTVAVIVVKALPSAAIVVGLTDNVNVFPEVVVGTFLSAVLSQPET